MTVYEFAKEGLTRVLPPLLTQGPWARAFIPPPAHVTPTGPVPAARPTFVARGVFA